MFITFEGIDGAGKSTQARLLAERLRDAGRDVVLTREPGGSTWAEEIRSLLVAGDPGRWSPETEILLFTAARCDHVERTIQPALDSDRIVLCDRYLDSTRAYQGTGPLRDRVDALHDLMIRLMPDLTLIFDMDPGAGLARTGQRGTVGEDRFDNKGLTFQQRLRAAYLDIFRAEPTRCQIIDAAQPVDFVAEQVAQIVLPRLQVT